MYFITDKEKHLTHPQVICVVYATNISDIYCPPPPKIKKRTQTLRHECSSALTCASALSLCPVLTSLLSLGTLFQAFNAAESKSLLFTSDLQSPRKLPNRLLCLPTRVIHQDLTLNYKKTDFIIISHKPTSSSS